MLLLSFQSFKKVFAQKALGTPSSIQYVVLKKKKNFSFLHVFLLMHAYLPLYQTLLYFSLFYNALQQQVQEFLLSL